MGIGALRTQPQLVSNIAILVVAALLAPALIFPGHVAASVSTPAPGSVVPRLGGIAGPLTLASAQWAASDLIITFREGVRFTLPGNAGYTVYERNDSNGARRLCIASHNESGLAFELLVDVFSLDQAAMTPIDMLGRSILSAGRRVAVVRSTSADAAGLSGFDLILQGVSYDRQVPQTDLRAVFLTDLEIGILFTLVERQHRPDEHTKALDDILATLSLAMDDGQNA